MLDDDFPDAPLRILLLEDSDLDAELVGAHVAGAGLAHELDRVITREAFLAALRSGIHDLILADYVLPSFDGLAALAMAREIRPEIPFVFVSGMLGEDIAVEALKGGATDYVTKQRLDRLPRTILRALKEARAHAERELARRTLSELNETLERRVEARTRDLALAVEALRREVAEREKAQAALRVAQRLEAVGQLTSGVAHDFNNLLTVILGNVGFLERGATDPATRRRLAMMRAAAERGASLTGQLLAFSRRQRLEPKPVDLNETVASMRDLLQSSIGGSIRIETYLQSGLWPAMVDPTHIELVILNLAINARDAMQVGGSLAVETANVRVRSAPRRPGEPERGEYVMISVTDTGTGIPPEVLERVFEPFFTTKAVGKGSGLGLAQVYGFAQQSGGGVRIDTAVGEGTSVKVYLPKARTSPVDETVGRVGFESRHPARIDPVVLVVDDDAAVREITAATLHDLGYGVVEAGSGPQALAVLDGERRFDALVVDFAMPGMNGAEVAREARRRRPGLAILFVTGFADMAELIDVGQASEQQIVQKPFRDDELARKLREALDRQPDNVIPLEGGRGAAR
ncbi:MAG TPA: response regulator [Salinarimonas sp.]|nr:response regulator [Salinarimonas sp.]